jgi:MFS transporter, FSR family, fosmidomycin resistance protein
MSRHAGFPNQERNVMLLAGVGHFATHFFELMFPTLAVTVARELRLPLTEVLGWSFGCYLLFGLGALPAGFLADRFGARRVLLLGLAGMGVSALAAGEAEPGRSLALCLASLGLFASFYHPAGMSLISHNIAARGQALGINGICGSLGIALAPIVTVVLVSHVGSRHAFQVTGLAACTVAAGLAMLRIDDDHGKPARRQDPLLSKTVPDGANRWDLFVLLCVAAMLGGISYRGNTVVQPAYFAERVSSLGFGTVTTLVYLFGVVGQYIGGTLADRYDLRWLYLAFHATSLPLLLLMSRLAQAPLVTAAALFVFFSLGMQPIENSLFARCSPPRWRATGYGVKFVLTFGVGSLAVLLVQWVKAGADLSSVFVYLAGIVALLVLTITAFVTLSAGEAIYNVPPTGEAKLSVGEPAV